MLQYTVHGTMMNHCTFLF